MRVCNDKLLDAVTVAASESSAAQPLDHIALVDIMTSITAANGANKTFDTGTMEVQTLTFPAKAASTDGDYVVFYDQAGNAWAVALDKTGLAAAEPTGAAWTAIPAGRKTYVDISGGTDAASVAALIETAIDALTGLTTVITTDDAAANGTMLLTQTVPGPTTNPVPHNADDSGAGSITGVQTTAGVATEVDLTANAVTIPNHGYTTGMKISGLSSTGTLPAGLSNTTYYAIVVDANTIKFATSQSNALAGTAVDITGYGTTAAVHTVTVETTIAGSVKIQKNNEPEGATAIWLDVGSSSQNFTGTTVLNWAYADVGYRQLRQVVTVTSGMVAVSTRVNGKGA